MLFSVIIVTFVSLVLVYSNDIKVFISLLKFNGLSSFLKF